jgi:hypothetical protein
MLARWTDALLEVVASISSLAADLATDSGMVPLAALTAAKRPA